MDAQDRNDLNKLMVDFQTHVALCEERMSQIYRDAIRDRDAEKENIKGIKESIDRLNKLVWSVGGSTIFVLATALLAGLLK